MPGVMLCHLLPRWILRHQSRHGVTQRMLRRLLPRRMLHVLVLLMQQRLLLTQHFHHTNSDDGSAWRHCYP